MMLSLDTAYRSFGGEVEASSTPTICRLPDSRRHQLSAIARPKIHFVQRTYGPFLVKGANSWLCLRDEQRLDVTPGVTLLMVGFVSTRKKYCSHRRTCLKDDRALETQRFNILYNFILMENVACTAIFSFQQMGPSWLSRQ